ncbi:MAG: hypothetical protein P1V97_34150 [Planctomycetota bacterium]|nr:hypothetical protein [Planctomycetota bacterium]
MAAGHFIVRANGILQGPLSITIELSQATGQSDIKNVLNSYQSLGKAKLKQFMSVEIGGQAQVLTAFNVAVVQYVDKTLDQGQSPQGLPEKIQRLLESMWRDSATLAATSLNGTVNPRAGLSLHELTIWARSDLSKLIGLCVKLENEGWSSNALSQEIALGYVFLNALEKKRTTRSDLNDFFKKHLKSCHGKRILRGSELFDQIRWYLGAHDSHEKLILLCLATNDPLAGGDWHAPMTPWTAKDKAPSYKIERPIQALPEQVAKTLRDKVVPQNNRGFELGLSHGRLFFDFLSRSLPWSGSEGELVWGRDLAIHDRDTAGLRSRSGIVSIRNEAPQNQSGKMHFKTTFSID